MHRLLLLLILHDTKLYTAVSYYSSIINNSIPTLLDACIIPPVNSLFRQQFFEEGKSTVELILHQI